MSSTAATRGRRRVCSWGGRRSRRFGARLRAEGTAVRLEPGDLYGTTVHVPGDISSAAFLLVAAAIVRDAEVSVTRVGVNPTRTGILTVLEAMGARVEVARAEEDIEPTANLTLGAAELRAVRVGGPLVPRLIDEVPALAVAAVVARGVTTIGDAGELRVKESDRIATLAREFGKMGVRVEERADGMVSEGPQPFRGARVASGGDHRMAMALVVAGLVADGGTGVGGTAGGATSLPPFVQTPNRPAGGAAGDRPGRPGGGGAGPGVPADGPT